MPSQLLSTDGKDFASSSAGSSTGSYLVPRALLGEVMNAVRKKLVLRSLAARVFGPSQIPGRTLVLPLQTDNDDLMLVDEVSEVAMFSAINDEREKRGVAKLGWHSEVVLVARSHARDMWERNFFGHFSPELEDVGDRLKIAEIKYRLAGENLALAPTVQTAHTGLMNSKGHRENILDPQFGKVGIGVIDNGIYGKIFVQVFTD